MCGSQEAWNQALQSHCRLFFFSCMCSSLADGLLLPQRGQRSCQELLSFPSYSVSHLREKVISLFSAPRLSSPIICLSRVRETKRVNIPVQSPKSLRSQSHYSLLSHNQRSLEYPCFPMRGSLEKNCVVIPQITGRQSPKSRLTC